MLDIAEEVLAKANRYGQITVSSCTIKIRITISIYRLVICSRKGFCVVDPNDTSKYVIILLFEFVDMMN